MRQTTIVSLLLLAGCASQQLQFPVTPAVFIDGFEASEGITFNGEGHLYIAANEAVWRVTADGRKTRLTELYTHLGQAGIGERDILQADFGPTNVFRDGANDDGIVWRITPEGDKSVFATGIADPNFILVMPDGNILVSDDGTDKIYELDRTGRVAVFTTAIPFPNGLALSPDGKTLYAAQIFTGLDPIGFDDSLWALPLENYRPAGEARVVARTGRGGVDGLAMDRQGRVYIADNGGGAVFRYDPVTDELVLIAEGMPNVASLVFGEGNFDHEALYATTTRRGGGIIWKIPVGTTGVRQYR